MELAMPMSETGRRSIERLQDIAQNPPLRLPVGLPRRRARTWPGCPTNWPSGNACIAVLEARLTWHEWMVSLP